MPGRESKFPGSNEDQDRYYFGIAENCASALTGNYGSQ